MKLSELREELKVIKEWENDVSKCTHIKAFNYY